MNRYNSREAAKFKNSLVATFFSVVEHFKPKFFIFENVKNFALANQSSYLKTAIKCCLKLGYQVRGRAFFRLATMAPLSPASEPS